jgi:hypothetical protein
MMRTHAIGAGLAGLLLLGAAAGFGPSATGPATAGQVSQYCVPARDYPDAHRFYCDHEQGGPGPTGAAALG